MNCKQGDLAVVVGGKTGKNVGKIVRCVRFLGQVEGISLPNIWEVDVELVWTGGRSKKETLRRIAADGAMRPIRPNDGEDETLTWVGKPQKVTA